VKLLLKGLFGGIFLLMIALTVRTGMQASLWSAWPGMASNPWAIATLYDAYFGFVTFYVWVYYKEPKMWIRAAWFVLIMGLGNIAMSLYVLIQLFGLKQDEGVAEMLQRRHS